MSDRELNLAIHQEVEGWVGHVNPNRDYCNDPVWCVQMMEKHGLSPKPRYEGTTGRYLVEWKVWQSDRPVASGSSLTRAVAIAVLQLTREGK